MESLDQEKRTGVHNVGRDQNVLESDYNMCGKIGNKYIEG